MSFSTDYSLDPRYDPMWSQDVAAYQYPQYEEQILNQRQGLSTGMQGFGLEVIPEEETVSSGNIARQAENALLSWRVGKAASTSWTSALSLSTQSSEIDLKEFLIQRGGHQPEGLHKAAAQGDRAGIMHLMKLQGFAAPINQLDGNGCTPLMYAVMADSKLAIEMLLNFSAKREQRDPEGRTAVHYAAFFGKHRSLKFLIESASDWTPKDVYGRTPLHWACASKSTRSLIVLLRHAQIVMGNINQQDNEGMTPLHCASHFCRPRHILLLNEAECDFSLVDIEGRTALHWTIGNPDASCIHALVDSYPPLLNRKDLNGSTLLHLTAANGSTHLVDALLKIEGIEIDAKDNLDRTALHLACAEGHSVIVQLLLECKALDSCVDSQGLTALHHAVQNNSLSSLKAFAKLPEVTHLPDNDGRTPLMVAAMNGFDEALTGSTHSGHRMTRWSLWCVNLSQLDPEAIAFSILLKNSVIASSVDQVDSNGRAALHLASQSGSASCITALLASGANPNLQDSLQQSALFCVCEEGHASCIQPLVAGGCRPETHDMDGQAPLHKAVLYGQQDSVQGLVLAGADLNIRDGNSNTAVHMATYGGNDRILSLLLENSANPNIQDANGMSPVHLAAMEGHINSLTVLLGFHAYVNFMDFSEERYTPLDYARLHNQNACVDILTSAGGVTTQTIKEMAAVSIQATYRGYRARVLYSKLTSENHAVTVIAAHFRGYWQRKKYKELKRRHYAAIKIQAFIRGCLQKIKFRKQLGRYREKERDRKLMEDFGRRVISRMETLQPFTAKISIPEEGKGEGELEEKSGLELRQERSRERRLRLEVSMKMREIYEEKQKRWQEFREAERQRRIDKANQEELDRLAGILACSRARREYSHVKFQQTNTIRLYYDAAVVIQRAFRQAKSRRLCLREQALKEEAQQRRMKNRAARIIQRAWRSYKQYRLYQALHFKSIMTSPVVTLPARPKIPSPPCARMEGIPSYGRPISITGNPKRKLHHTEQSCFRVFRPTTQDLLQRTILTNMTIPPTGPEDATRRPVANIQGLSRRLQPMEFSGRNQEIDRGRRMKKQRHLLPQLFSSSPTKRPMDKSDSKVTSFHLPEIVQL